MADWDTTNPEDNGIVSQYPANERAARAAVATNFGVDHHEADDADVGKHEVIQFTDETEPTITAGQIGLWNEGGVLKTRTGAGAASTVLFPAGTRMMFAQASAPVGWTTVTGLNDRVIRVDSASGGTTGGSWTISGVTVDNHSLTIGQMPTHNHGGSTGNAGSHNHTGTTSTNGSHSHSGSTDNDTHSHAIQTVSGTDGGNGSVKAHDSFNVDSTRNTLSDTHNHSLNINSNGNHNHTFTTSTQASHNHSISNQGSGSGHNHGLTADGNWRPAYLDVIICEKD